MRNGDALTWGVMLWIMDSSFLICFSASAAC